MLLDAETAAVVRVINPVSDIELHCYSQSFMKTPGEIVSLVENDGEIQMICYNQASNKVTTIRNYGHIR